MQKKIDQALDALLETEFVDFKTAKDINNDFIIMLRALEELRLETSIGKEVKAWFEEMLTHELEKLESCKLVF